MSSKSTRLSDETGTGELFDESPDIASPALEAARSRRRVLARAIRDVEAALAAAAPGREQTWRAAVTHRLVALGDAFEEHIDATERAEGLFEEIVRIAPRLSRAVESLRSEHDPIRTGIAEILELLLRPPGAALAVERIREVVIELLVRIARHRQRGADLVWDAYWVDIGGESSGDAG